MLFSRDKDDDDDFVPNPSYGSNLATIFGNSSGDGNSSLTYTAPKQPKPQNKAATRSMPSTSSSSNRVVIAKTVQTFKMIEGKYQAQGRLGAAVISINSEEGPAFQLLLYRDKHHQICIARITREFSFHIQPKNYCTFYDKQSVIWSILFENAVELMEFAFEVALARWKAGEPTTPVMVQDLWCPIAASVPTDSKIFAAESGDSVELTYTLHPVTNSNQDNLKEDTLEMPAFSTTTVFEERQIEHETTLEFSNGRLEGGVKESHSICVEVQGSGWTQGLVGAQPTGHRVVILQPFMLGDLNPREVMYNCPVAVKITVIQINKPPPREIPTVPLEDDIQKSTAKESPKPQGSPESLRDSPKPTKADLITRMARMGQALPFKATAHPSDSDETEEDQSSRVRPSERAVPKPRSRMHHTTAVAVPQPQAPAPLLPLSPASGPVTQQWAAAPYMVGNAYAVAPQLQSPITMDSQFNMYLSEVRTTNSELRMGLTRLTDKVDNLNDKIERSDKRGDNEVLERILENEQQMKQQLQLVLSAIQLTQNARSSVDSIPQVSASTMLAADNVSNQSSTETHQPAELLERIKKLEEENEYLQATVNAQKDALQNAKISDKGQLSRMNELQSQLQEEQQRVIELNQRVQNIELDDENLKELLTATKKTISELQTTLQEKQTSIDKLEQALKDSEATHLDEVRRSLQEVLDPKPVIGEHVKKILNAVYRLVKVQFEPRSEYETAFILSVLAETIKAVTLEYLQNGDLANSELHQTTLGSEKPIDLNQTHSAPAVSSEELSSAGEPSALAGQYVQRDQRGLAEGEARSASKSDGPVSDAPEQSTSATAATPPVSADHNIDDSNVPLQGMPDQLNLINDTGKSKTEPSPSLADSSDDTSDNGDLTPMSDKLQSVLLHLSTSQTRCAPHPHPHPVPSRNLHPSWTLQPGQVPPPPFWYLNQD